ncbi:MAG TPA: 3-deoxy-manno-octulosonate cytidylyltransferase [bacterium]|nr:3-deoxy-manno-octulosonate cytidylyltransferase [bacterium]
MRKRIICVIPARYGSERLPGKVLYKIGEKTMLQRVYERAKIVGIFDKIYIATESRKVQEECEKFKYEVIWTSENCRTGSDRVAEAIGKIKEKIDIVVNIQADEPFLPIEAVKKPLEIMLGNPSINISTSVTKIREKEDLYNPNVVKVVLDKENNALYFSRSLIPYPRIYFNPDKLYSSKKVVFYKHIGVYIFRKVFLEKFAKMETTFLESIEKLEQLRIIENGYKIKTAIVKKDSPCVDTIGDIEKLKM